ncbi:DEAD/DEAH box helicase [Haloarcula sp. S1CR25-12]|uniref:DEAD/DEAH box helicase n=1 Tax=Haloarcula saliterrae TaxID=2950534 RepID=A0ABU2FDS7_9EURY|nr:DEAD/DEAH box helicase [Haloarcula sp. S1CR25-12]MDS0259966.1 DEAD/DEAH box helicase [Haloarcula sp. S1CR25-12]
MSRATSGQRGDLDVLEEVWSELPTSFKRELEQRLLRRINERCKRQINAGDYDATVALQDLYGDFVDSIADDNRFTDAVPRKVGEDHASRLVFQRLIDELEERNTILYVYDRQRVRSRVAEVTRYFALLRQRFVGEDYEFTPSLTKMVKMDIQSREKPKWGEDGKRINSIVRDIYQDVRTSDPAAELADAFDTTGDWQDAVEEALTLVRELCHELGMTGLAKYQGRAFQRLYLQSVTDDNDGTARVITASTGGGKTEAFLFPLLTYALTAAQANLNGARALLAYPRTDLCDNQFERIVHYLYTISDLIEADDSTPFNELPFTVNLQHSSSDDVEIDCPECGGRMSAEDDFECSEDSDHVVDYVSTGNQSQADIFITTPDTLHRRLMDPYGQNQFWKRGHPPKFVVLDEVHVYTDQYGMHVANLMRRLKATMSAVADEQDPVLVASSATISNAEDFTKRIFEASDAEQIKPYSKEDLEEMDDSRSEDLEPELEEIGWEYLVFVKSTEPRTVQIPQGDDVFKPRSEWEEFDETNVTNLSTMIQVAFAFYHTILKERPEDDDAKDKILGFVDSIDSVKRLGDYIQDAEGTDDNDDAGLYSLRKPDAFLPDTEQTNPDCPKELFRGSAASHETAVCEPLPPNPELNPCPVYEAGECWWTLQDDFLESMDVYLHKSGRTETPDGTGVNDDAWDMMVTTSALEVGFDHPSIIGTFQYRAPMNIPGFVQRKGRGGRDPGDQPISVVVLGTFPEDSFYFHHEELLSNPSDEYLKISLDEENEFVRTQHIVSAIFDYINVQHQDVSDEIYRRLEMPELINILETDREEIVAWLDGAFSSSDLDFLEGVLDDLTDYIHLTEMALAPHEQLEESGGFEKFWEALRIESGTKSKQIEREKEQLQKLLTQFEMLEGLDAAGGDTE